ncbi:hypothetical protein [Brevundimonas sp.]|uniref:hypothetical protein n=1 Tax=Brevundimonas sp. TaxID=1871086 RepID=UPI00356AB36F
MTAIATIVLAVVTALLAKETKRLSDATSEPMVVVTLESNPHSLMHMDLIAQNTGTGTAYEIRVSSNPPFELDDDQKELPVPLQNISVLKPGQLISSYICEYAKLEGRRFEICVSWSRKPGSAKRETLKYDLNLADFASLVRLGTPHEETVSKSLKSLAEHFRKFANGRLKVDSFDSRDRLHERRQHDRWRRRQQRERGQRGPDL